MVVEPKKLARQKGRELKIVNPVVIIGGGVAGLNCARLLQRDGIPFTLLEKSDTIGGRMRTDKVAGFRLDRGFQVLQTAYPEAQSALEFGELELHELEPGALIRKGNRWIKMSDPLRRPAAAWGTLFNEIGNLSDRFKLMKLWRDANRGTLEELITNPKDCTTLQMLEEHYRFSPSFIEQFLRPWLSGIFLETKLETSSNFFQFVFRMLASGKICYPAAGIGAIPKQLVRDIPSDRIRLNVAVRSIERSQVLLEDGQTIDFSALVIATDVHSAAQLTDNQIEASGSGATRCIYYAADQPPFAQPILLLNGESTGSVNHVFVSSNASPRVAPPGQALISVSQVGAAALEAFEPEDVRSQLTTWFGDAVREWRELRIYDLPHALPTQPPGFMNASRSLFALPPGTFACGDYRETASLNGALKSGRETAESVIAYLHSSQCLSSTG